MYAHDVPDTASALNKAVGIELDQLRRASNMTHQTLADRTGLGIATVKRYLGGTRDIPLPAFASMARALGAEPLEVFGRAETRVQQ